jgi:hypothetical protein
MGGEKRHRLLDMTNRHEIRERRCGRARESSTLRGKPYCNNITREALHYAGSPTFKSEFAGVGSKKKMSGSRSGGGF